MTKKTVVSLAVLVLLGGLLALADAPEVTFDGKITEGEYTYHYFDEDINMDVYWRMTDDDLYVALKAPATGWVAFGVRDGVPSEEEENVMEGVDFIIGYVKDGKLSIRDDFGDTPFTHKADTELGGSDDVLAFGGSEADGFTVIEFERLIDTGDEFDNPIAQGEAEVYLAYSDADDFVSIHTERTEVVLNFLTGQAEKEEEEE